MVAKIAWKNIWRNKLRSLVVITSIVLGLWAGAFIFAYVFGLIEQRLNVAIGYEISHLQIHQPQYLEDNDSKYYIDNTHSAFQNLENDPRVANYSKRVITHGMVNSATLSTGGKFFGINPNNENDVTQLSKLIKQGKYLEETDKNKVVIGKKLAEKLKVRLGSKIVLSFQDVDRNIVAGAFRVKGIYESINSTLEGLNIYVLDRDLTELLGFSDGCHEVAVLLNNSQDVQDFSNQLQLDNNNLTVRSWKEISPELGIMIDSIDQYMFIFLIIILLALSFGIINTMLMAVLERVKEIGVLMSIGMNKPKIFSMIFLETLFIVGIAAPIGLGLAYLTINHLGAAGLDTSGFQKDAYAAFGIESIVYPKLAPIYYLRIFIMVSITALLASLYPSYTAIKLDPVKAIRKI